MIGAIFLDQGYRAATQGLPAEHRRPRRVERRELQGSAPAGVAGPDRRHPPLPRRGNRRARPQARIHRRGAAGRPGRRLRAGTDEAGGRAGRRPRRAGQAEPHSRGGAAAAAGAARDAAKTVASEPARIRRRVAEVAADRGATPRRRRGRGGGPAAADPAAPDEPTGASRPRRSLLAALRHAAEALVGRQPAAPPPPAPEAPAPRRRRGRRGGRGRGGSGGGGAPAATK